MKISAGNPKAIVEPQAEDVLMAGIIPGWWVIVKDPPWGYCKIVATVKTEREAIDIADRINNE